MANSVYSISVKCRERRIEILSQHNSCVSNENVRFLRYNDVCFCSSSSISFQNIKKVGEKHKDEAAKLSL